MGSLGKLCAGALVSVCVALAACAGARIEPFGETRIDTLCNDVKRCEARGDKVVNLLGDKKAPRLYLAPDKGPEQLLGKVAPKRKANSVMKTCGAEISANDWHSAPEAVRQMPLGKHAKEELRRRLRAYLSARVATLNLPENDSVEASLSAVVDEAAQLDRVSWVSQTYWLTDTAFERRVGQCGEDERDNIIYSLTVLSPSQAFQADLTFKLARALRAKLGAGSTSDAGAEEQAAAEPPAAATDDADAGADASRYDTVARDVARTMARDTRVVAALGFDDT